MTRVRRTYSEEELRLERCARRLREDLGVNAAGVEVILRMRQQMLELQAHMNELEARLAHQSTQRGARLARYREAYFEARWEELGDELP